MRPSLWQFFQRASASSLVICVLFVSHLGCELSSDQASSPGESNTQASHSAADTNVSPQGHGPEARPQVPQTHGTAAAGLPKIVAFGNSLTAGLGVASEDSYPEQLQQWLDQAGYRVRVINAGVSGETSAGGLRRVDWVLKSKPSLVILELGGNDGLRGIAPEQTQANLEQIIRRFQEAQVPLVLAGMKLPPNYGAEFTSRFAAIYPELAGKYRLPFMPFFLENVATHDGLVQADGIHPTAKGYRVIVGNLMPVIEPLLADMRPGRS